MISQPAVVFDGPHQLTVRELSSRLPGPGEVRVDVSASGISTGTERLLFTGEMPPFPGLGYPLVPGYESVGVVTALGDDVSSLAVGDSVFVPGGGSFEGARSLFGGTAAGLTVKAARAWRLPAGVGEEGLLLALLGTAHHAAMATDGTLQGDLVIGHGVLGRLAARLLVAKGRKVTVWELNPARAAGAVGYQVLTPEDDPRRDYGVIIDLSGDSNIMDTAFARLKKGGELVLAGFYKDRLSFSFPTAFMREARVRVAAEWTDADLTASIDLVASGALDLSALITHRFAVKDAPAAYTTAFNDPACLKALINWSST